MNADNEKNRQRKIQTKGVTIDEGKKTKDADYE